MIFRQGFRVACINNIVLSIFSFNFFLFKNSYPSSAQFDKIGIAVVKVLKLPLKKENIVSLLNNYQ